MSLVLHLKILHPIEIKMTIKMIKKTEEYISCPIIDELGGAAGGTGMMEMHVPHLEQTG